MYETHPQFWVVWCSVNAQHVSYLKYLKSDMHQNRFKRKSSVHLNCIPQDIYLINSLDPIVLYFNTAPWSAHHLIIIPSILKHEKLELEIFIITLRCVVLFTHLSTHLQSNSRWALFSILKCDEEDWRYPEPCASNDSFFWEEPFLILEELFPQVCLCIIS